MKVFVYQRKEGSAFISISLELSDEATFRLSLELSDSFGMEEKISTGNYSLVDSVLTLSIATTYRYSKYLTDLNPNEEYSDSLQLQTLKCISNGVLFPFEQETILLQQSE